MELSLFPRGVKLPKAAGSGKVIVFVFLSVGIYPNQSFLNAPERRKKSYYVCRKKLVQRGDSVLKAFLTGCAGGEDRRTLLDSTLR